MNKERERTASNELGRGKKKRVPLREEKKKRMNIVMENEARNKRRKIAKKSLVK